MSFFSRLTDIVTCNLTEILENEADPHAAIQQIIHEMEEGLAGADRSVATAERNEERFRLELEECSGQIEQWNQRARTALSEGREDDAREALLRRSEVEDLIAGIEQQHQGAVSTLKHLSTTRRALEARLADARRKQQSLETGAARQASGAGSAAAEAAMPTCPSRSEQVEAELEALKKELGK